jgi:tetratricopeptide (TPR) repeat protein
MKTSRTITRQPIKYYLLQLAVFSIIMLIYSYFNVDQSLLYAGVTYLVLAIVIRIIVLLHHYMGKIYYRRSEYEKAITEFEKSYAFLSKYRFIDTYRYVTILSSQNSFIEMSLLNIAFCYLQMNVKKKAKEYYILTLNQFPDSPVATEELKKL